MLGAFLFGLTLTQAAFAGCNNGNGGCSAPVAAQPCGEQATGECYCMYVKYEPCYYTTKRCVEECIPCKRKCSRTVPRYYEVQRCRYVPQYYTETVCKNEREYYYVDDVKTCQKTVCEQHVKYVPKYYWKHNGASCNTGASACAAPVANGCN